MGVAREFGGLTVACICENELLPEVARQEAAEISRMNQVPLSVFPLLERTIIVGPPQPGRPQTLRSLRIYPAFYLEYERSATTRGDIRDKLMPFFRVARRDHHVPMIFVCETREAASLFREVHRNMDREFGGTTFVLTSTYAEVSAGDQFETCWNLNGVPVLPS